ncbi:MAG: hypothetical protein IK016_02825 [Lachnospiraceae bacterium]|nr:hypothetical protein [Lachnospiraceae bacterium]
MIELYYDAATIAHYIIDREMSEQQKQKFLTWVQSQEFEYLAPKYREKESPIDNKRVFMLDVHRSWDAAVYGLDGFEFSIKTYFAYMRLDIMYGETRDFIRIKRGKLLEKFNKERLRSEMRAEIHDCMMFYHIQAYLKGGEEIDIADANNDDMITFRVV